MKNLIIKILAALLTVWYSMSFIGFDIHTCNGSGRSFVVTFIEGLTCEDIHPEHSCGKAVCCTGGSSSCSCGDHHNTSCTIKAPSCCTNDYQVLAITGTVSSHHDHYDECGCGFCPCVGFPVSEIQELHHENNLLAYILCPDSGVVSACERQAALRVWRI